MSGGTGQQNPQLRFEQDANWPHTVWAEALKAGDVDTAQAIWDLCTEAEIYLLRTGGVAMAEAIEWQHTSLLSWLLQKNFDVHEHLWSSSTPLLFAAQTGWIAGMQMLIAAGARLPTGPHFDDDTCEVFPVESTVYLLEAGIDPAALSRPTRRALVGLPPHADEQYLNAVSTEQYLRSRLPRYGSRNPEPVQDVFWSAMVRSGLSAFRAYAHFKEPCGGPIWCAKRSGQSITRLLDGRVVQIGGNHDDFCEDVDFTYNDVFVHEPDGSFQIFTYPKGVFWPVDFHTATLCGDAIVIIGSLHEPKNRVSDQTRVYKLDTHRWHIECLDTRGPSPGSINGHCASLVAPDRIRVTDSRFKSYSDGKEPVTHTGRAYILDLKTLRWSVDFREVKA